VTVQKSIEELSQRVAEAPEPMSSLAQFGSIDQVPIAEVLKYISSQELSGDLQIIAGRAIRTLYFDRGFLVFGGSNLKRYRLTDRLLEAGRVTEKELEMAFRLLKGKGRIGEAMIQAGLITEEELGHEVVRQIKRIVLSSFGLKEGIYSFDERECVVPMDLRLGLSIYRLQLEGIRRMNDRRLILRGLGSLERRLRSSEVPPFSFEQSELWSVEREVMKAAGKGQRLHEILRLVVGNELQVLQAIYGLLRAGILEPATNGQRASKVQEDIGTFLLSNLNKDSSSEQAENVRQEVLLQFDALEQTSASELLEVEEAAGEEEIRRAYGARQGEWNKKHALIAGEKSMSVKVEEIKRRLARAHESILEKKKSHAAPIEASGDGPKAQTRLQDDAVTDTATVETQPFQAQEEVSAAAGEAGCTDGLQTGGTAEEDDGSATGSKERGTPKEEIKRLFYEIKVRQTVNDIEGVVSLLFEVVRLEPKSPKYEAMLAEALASHPVLGKRAERHFRIALSLDPQNANLHYRLGRYYQKFGQTSRALSEFKVALRIDPHHAQARSAVVEVKKSNATPMEKMFKKFFG
jgi:tetratricopeptide (TPR) repeat protein